MSEGSWRWMSQVMQAQIRPPSALLFCSRHQPMGWCPPMSGRLTFTQPVIQMLIFSILTDTPRISFYQSREHPLANQVNT